MAAATPTKLLPDKHKFDKNTCLCCNVVIGDKNHPFCLNTELREKLSRFISEKNNQGFDDLDYPKKICRSCKRSLESAERFQKLVQQSHNEQTATLVQKDSRIKRLRNEEDSPSAQNLRVSKRSHPASARSLFQPILPRPVVSTPQLNSNVSNTNNHVLCTSGIRDSKVRYDINEDEIL